MRLEQLDAWIRRLKELGGPSLPARVAAKAERYVDEALKRTARAGQTPAGEPWAATKKGGAPLKNAASHISTKSSGAMIIATLAAPDSFHDRGIGHAPRRQVLPETGDIPPAVEEALERAARETFEEIVGR